MAATSAIVLISPDFKSGAVHTCKVYNVAGSLGCSILAPTGTDLTIAAADIQGGGAFIIQQTGILSGGNAYNALANTAFCMSGGIRVLSTGTVLPGPDFTCDQSGGGGQSMYRVGLSAEPLTWTGGIGVPVMMNGQDPHGTICGIVNYAGGNLNIPDVTNGGSLYVGGLNISLAYKEVAFFMYEGSGVWTLFSRGYTHYQSGGNGGPGANVVKTLNATPVEIFGFPVGHTQTPGLGVEFTIFATKDDGGVGTVQGQWIKGHAVWDGANNLLASSKGTVTGTNTGAPPTGWDIAFFSNVGGRNGITIALDSGFNCKARIRFNTDAAPE